MIQTWAPEGVNVEKKDCLSHHEVMTRAEVYDGDRGVKLVGHRVRVPWSQETAQDGVNKADRRFSGLLPTKMGCSPQPSTYQLWSTFPHIERLRSDTTAVLHEGGVNGEDSTAGAVRRGVIQGHRR